MSFANRLFSYVFNELMVNALANSRTFQRFAVRSDAFMKEAAKGETVEAAKRAAEEAKRAYAKTSDLAKEGATRANTAARDWNGTTMARLRDFGRRLNLSRDGDADEAVSQAELEWYSINLPALELARGTTYGALREFPLDLLGLGAPAGAADVAAGDVAALLEGAAFSEGAGPAEREAAARAALAAAVAVLLSIFGAHETGIPAREQRLRVYV